MAPWIITHAQHDDALARLSRRSPESLAAFIVSLAHDRGPVGEQVRNFIVADDPAQLVAELERRIAAIGHDGRHRYSNHESGRPVGERLNFILNTIEIEILRTNPQKAFHLLVRVIEQDGAAMEIVMDYEHEIVTAIDCATALLAQAAAIAPVPEYLSTLTRLVEGDHYGARGAVGTLRESLTHP